jgi:O6-methylguanine-DNA--protein-cysteine methyltransferase
MLKHTVPFLVLSVLFVAACAKIDYIGQSYPPTTHVDLYFSDADIREDYQVMGHVIAQANEGISIESLQKQLEAKAREKGADGIVIHGFDRIQTGETTTYNEEAKRGEKKRSIAAITITSAEEERQIKAIFIKYEQNL